MNFISTYVIPVYMNQRNPTIDLPSSFDPEIRQGRAAFYLNSGKEEFYSIYLMYFLNGIRFC